ncbi:MAG: HAD family phosphatase [Planctomycetales bacterium]|nr:HAD family phosphatase [Planctomycetales bacterium]
MNALQPILLFDVMETLVTDPFRDVIPDFFGLSLDELLAAKHPTAWIDFEKGLISQDEYFRVCFLDGRTVDGKTLVNRVAASYDWLDGMRPLLAELHARRHEMHAFSNYPVWYELIEARLGLSRYIDWTFVSCHTGLRKPDPQAYRHAIDILGVDPPECLFIDDRQVNVDAALNVGMDAILMRGAEDLRGELRRRHIID